MKKITSKTENHHTIDKITIIENIVTPFDIKKGMTARESAISKISGAKNNVDQINSKTVNLLYLDFQTDMISDIVDYSAMPSPIITNISRGGVDGGIYSNILLYVARHS